MLTFDPLNMFGGSVMFILLFLLLSSVARIYFHSHHVPVLPESSILILVGCIVGFVLFLFRNQFDLSFLSFPTDHFFFILIPPIILDAGYFLSKSFFFNNLPTILSYATVGTVFNTFATSFGLYLVTHYSLTKYTLSVHECLLLGTALSAVDPVSVLAIFSENSVNQTLHNLVFGESVLNDAVSIVIFRLVNNISSDSTTIDTAVNGFFSFLLVSSGGLIIGIVFGIFSTFMTLFTKNTAILEPLVILVTAYLSYTLAEAFHFSGIVSILVVGIMNSIYIEQNISYYSSVTLKYLLKLLSSTAETIIFIYLGIGIFVDLPGQGLKTDWLLVVWTLLFIHVSRLLSVITLSAIANCFRVQKIQFSDMIVLYWGGIRGSISFGLVFSAPLTTHKSVLLSTTMFITLFTVFVQGSTIKPFLKWLRIRTEKKEDSSVLFQHVFHRGLDYLKEGVDTVMGNDESFVVILWRNIDRFIQKTCLRSHELIKEEGLVEALDELVYQETVEKISGEITDLRRETLLTNVKARNHNQRQSGEFSRQSGEFSKQSGDLIRTHSGLSAFSSRSSTDFLAPRPSYDEPRRLKMSYEEAKQSLEMVKKQMLDDQEIVVSLSNQPRRSAEISAHQLSQLIDPGIGKRRADRLPSVKSLFGNKFSDRVISSSRSNRNLKQAAQNVPKRIVFDVTPPPSPTLGHH
ncbi:hypothetical protein RCL1_003350 [Eukaryota sp. TZLM3-RCL]